ncbi:hypothetical protein FALCPG4_017094 [Fusarium falciforme]
MASTQDQKKTVVVIGGTGLFGGSVVTSLLDNPEFHVRVTSRDPTSVKAKRVRDQGAEVVLADSWKSDELVEAFKGAWALFLNTDSDNANFKAEIGPPESEMGRIVIDAAVKQDVKHFVFSGLPEAPNVTKGEVPILSFDNEAAIWAYAQKASFETVTSINTRWALEAYGLPQYGKAFGGFHIWADEEGYLTLKVSPMGNSPDSVPWASIQDDFGDVVHGFF